MRLSRLEWRLPAAIAVLLLLVAGTLAGFTYAESRRAAAASARARLQYLGTLLSNNFQTNAAGVRQTSAQLAKDPDVVGVLAGAAPSDQLRKRLASTLQNATYSVELWNAAGEELLNVQADAVPEVDLEWNAALSWAKPDEVTLSPIVGAKNGGAYAIASPVHDEAGRFVGYVVNRRRVGAATTVQTSARLVVELMGPESRILVGHPDTVWVDVLGQSSGPIGPVTPGADGVYWATENDTRWLGVTEPIKGTGWHLRIEFPDRVVFAQSREVLWNTIRIALIVAGLGAIGGWVMSRRLIRPLRALTDAAVRVANGTEPAHVDAKRADEIGELASAFNTMAERVAEGRQNLEARVAERTEELARALSQLEEDARQLARSNRELEAFSYTISHDLRAPLRSIDGFSDALLTDYGDQLDETAKSHLHRVRRAAKRMGVLIDDLLELSRVSRTELISSPVALEPLAARLARDLQEREPDRKVNVIIHPTPPAQGDARLLALVLQNLFENAWKFTSRREDACIEFGVVEGQGAPLAYFVRDNGVGFDMAHSAKLFGIFQRLHTVDEFPGTGVGLAIVQRIIERHGGRVWVEAEPGAGATFFFTLETRNA